MTKKQWIGHPCFDDSSRHIYSRVHLPVAPKCNIQCNFCDRKYDCVNESRPGVSSVILSPGQSMAYLEKVMLRVPYVSVVGIAGPGDPLANPQETLETLALVRARYPRILLCLATNGLVLPEYVDRIAELMVSHVTVTVNAIDPNIGSKIYAWARDGKRIVRGREAAALLLERQLEGIRLLKARGVTVKINFILIPGINDGHVGEVAKKMSALGADIFNCMALIPSPGSPFGTMPAPLAIERDAARVEAGKYLPQMKHCARCRADAVGIIGRDMDETTLNDLQTCAQLPLKPEQDRPYIAVATMEGVLVNQHLGRCEEFQIYTQTSAGFEVKEVRQAPSAGEGDARWERLAETFSDCRAVLVSAAGNKPVEFLKASGVDVVEMDGLI
ncbi:MAG: nitrogenase cofactor biosynthesis protein NifB, partial [Candidatus Omnitrophica bacterium]|nr:nitrogenase cofactor biosynthesis protein NifB [Candidatus Omnitrophota bacterium]